MSWCAVKNFEKAKNPQNHIKSFIGSRIKSLRQKIVTLFPNPAYSQSLLLCEIGIFSWFFHLNEMNAVMIFPLVESIRERFAFENRKSHKCKPARTILAKSAESFKICSNSKCKNPSELKIPRGFLFLLFVDKPSKKSHKFCEICRQRTLQLASVDRN